MVGTQIIKPVAAMSSTTARSLLPAITLLTLSICPSVMAKTSPMSVTPSNNWYGDAGSWSAVSVKVGKPEQDLDVIISTSSSDLAVVASTACTSGDLTCSTERGTTFNSSQSSSWKTEGNQPLDIDTSLGENVNATFGTDTLSYGSSSVSVKDTLIGAFNSTDFWLGFYGVGIPSGSDSAISATSLISQLVETASEIPSHSYGYTAGASYRNFSQNSLILGGMDKRRFIDNDITFQLSDKNQPSAYINAINLTLPDGSAVPSNWLAKTVPMVNQGQMVTEVLIDSSTPYLWLPGEICENFASALNLTYNSTLNLYTFDRNPAQRTTLQNLNFSISVQLSPKASSVQAVTIDFPYQSFDQQMTHPETKYYFPLKRATNESQFTLGRTFLQEAYLIVDYERSNFSVHQTLFPSDATTNTTGITEISRPANSQFTGPNSHQEGSIPKDTIAGVVVCVALVALLIIANFYRIRYNRLKAAQNPQAPIDKPISKAGILLAKLRIRKRQSRTHLESGNPRATIYETDGNAAAFPVEIGADAAHERFEMAAPIAPVELDGDTSELRFSKIGAHGLPNSQISEYEREQLRMHYAMQRGNTFPEKRDVIVNTHQNGTYRSEHSMISAESTMTSDLSPLSTSQLMEGDSPVSPIRDPPPSYQRHAHSVIPEGAEIIFAGSIPHISPGMEVGFLPDPRADSAGLSLGSGFRMGEGSVRDTLGSDYTVDETLTMQHGGGGEADREYEAMMSPGGVERNLDGQDLVHVPQVAAKRYSWESGV